MYSVAFEPAAPAVVGHRRGAERRGAELYGGGAADAAERAVGRERGVVVTRSLFQKVGLDGAFDGLLSVIVSFERCDEAFLKGDAVGAGRADLVLRRFPQAGRPRKRALPALLP